MDSDPETWALDLQGVEKVYGSGRKRIEALRGVSLRVRPGEIFGLLGPNGAGKSTLVKIMMTVVRANRAAGTILGRPVGDKATLARVGYLPEHHNLPHYLTGRKMLEFFGALAGVARPQRKKRAGELIELVGMAASADRRIDTYSKGMLQRVGVAQALMNDPELVVLDEPTDGVDPIGRHDILNVLQHLRERGRTVFVNSHLLTELELISDRVAILLRGQVVRQGTIGELAAHRQWYELDITPQTAAPVAALLAVTPGDRPGVLTGQLGNGAWVEVSEQADGATVRIGTADPTRIQETLDRLRQAQCVIHRVEVVRPSLEELFMEAMTEGQFPAGPHAGVSSPEEKP